MLSHFISVQFSCSVMSDSAIPWTATCQATLSITNPRSLPKLMSIELAMPSNHVTHPPLSVPSNSVTPWTVACQAPLSMGILQARILEWIAMPSSRGSSQPNPGMEPESLALALQVDSLPLSHPGSPLGVSVVRPYHTGYHLSVYAWNKLESHMLHYQRWFPLEDRIGKWNWNIPLSTFSTLHSLNPYKKHRE